MMMAEIMEQPSGGGSGMLVHDAMGL